MSRPQWVNTCGTIQDLKDAETAATRDDKLAGLHLYNENKAPVMQLWLEDNNCDRHVGNIIQNAAWLVYELIY